MRAPTCIFFVALLFMPLGGCGQKGPLFIPPSCSPVLADGRVRELTDKDGNVLPPCPPPEIGGDEEPTLQDEELLNEEI